MRPMLGVPLIHACAAAWIMCMPVPLRCDLDSRVRPPTPPHPASAAQDPPRDGQRGSERGPRLKLYESNSLNSGRCGVQDNKTTFPLLCEINHESQQCSLGCITGVE